MAMPAKGLAALAARHGPAGVANDWRIGPGCPREPLARGLDAVELKTESMEKSLFGIGLQVSEACKVQKTNMRDSTGQPLTSVAVGDVLTHVDGRSTSTPGLRIREDMILGEGEGTLVHLVFRSAAKGHTFEVTARRHVHVRSWTETSRAYRLREALAGDAELCADAKLVPALDDVRRLVADSAGNAADLMSAPGIRATLGIVLGATQARALQIADMAPTGPAALSRRIEKGDTIVAVDDVTATADNIPSLLEGSGAVGSRAKLKLLRNGKHFELELFRAIEKRFAAADQIVAKISEQQDRASQSASAGDAASAFAAIRSMVLELSRQNAELDWALSRRLFEVQGKLLNGIESSFQCIHPMPAGVNVEPLTNDQLLARRIQELEEELAKSRKSEREKSESLVELRQKLQTHQTDLDAQEATRIRLASELEALRAQFDKKQHNSELLELRAEIARLLEWKNVSVRRDELDDAEKQARVQQERISDLTQQIAALKLQVAESEHARAEAQIYHEQVDQLKEAMKAMVPKDDLLASESARALLQKEMSDLRGSLVARQVHAGVVEEREALKAEVGRWKSKSEGMIPKSERDLVQVEVDRLQAQVQRLNKKIAELVPREELVTAEKNAAAVDDQNKMLSKKLKESETALSDLKATVKNDMVPKKELQAVEMSLRETRGAKANLQEDHDKQTKALRAMEHANESLESQIRMATDKLKKATGDLDQQRSSCKALQGQLDETSMQLRAKSKAHSEILESLSKAAAAKQELEIAMQQTVTDRKYREVNDELSAVKKKFDEVSKQVDEIKAANEHLQQQNTKLAATSLQSFWRRISVQTVPMPKYLKALNDANETQQQLALEKTHNAGLEERNTELNMKIHELDDEIAILTLAHEDKVSKSELTVAKQELAHAHAEIAATAAELDRSAKSVASLSSELETCKQELEALQNASVKREELAQLRAELANCQIELNSKVQECEKLRESYAKLQRLCEESNASASAAAEQRLAAKTADLDAALEKLQAADSNIFLLQRQLAQAKLGHEEFVQGMKSANDLRSLNAEIAKLKERLSASVPRTELLSSQRTATALHDENISLKTSLGNLRASLQDQVHIVRAEIMEMNDFIQEASGMVPESVYAALHVKMQRVARELQDLQDEKLRLQADLSDVRSQRDVLKTAVEDLERQIQEMVKRDVWQHADSQAKTFKDESSALKIENEALGQQLKTLQTLVAGMVAKEEMLDAQRRSEEAERDLRNLKLVLNQVALSKMEDLTAFVDVMKGPPCFDAREVVDLLKAMRGNAKGITCEINAFTSLALDLCNFPGTIEQVRSLLRVSRGPPERALSEVCALIRALNGETEDDVWSSAEMVKLLEVMRKHPKLSVIELDEMLNQCDSQHELQRIISSICSDPDLHTIFPVGGIGVLLEELHESEGGGFYVKELLDGGPAAADGRIRAGDQVMYIDGEEVFNKAFPVVTSLLRGAPGSSVEIVLIQAAYRKEKFADVRKLPAKAWYSVTLLRQESAVLEQTMRVTLAQAGSQHLVQVNAPELEEPSEPHLWQSVSSVLWAEDSSPTHPPMSARTIFDFYVHTLLRVIHKNSARSHGRISSTFVPEESYITEPGIYKTSHSQEDLFAM